MRDLMVIAGIAEGAIAARRFVAPSAVAGRDYKQAPNNGDVVGVAMAAAKDGERVELAVVGTALVEAGGGILAGKLVGSDADGKAVTPGDGERCGGVLLQAAAADGDLVDVLLSMGTA